METILQNEKERVLWKMAKKRVSFRRGMAAYIIVNAFLWSIWAISGDKNEDIYNGVIIPWPIWCTLGWGIGMAFSFYGAYISNPLNDIEKEFQKLKERN